MTDTIGALVGQTRALVDQITRDDYGQMVGQIWMGGNGGLLSRETLMRDMDNMLAMTPINWSMLNWFAAQGVPRQTLFRMVTSRIVQGNRASDGWLEEDTKGDAFLAFYEEAPEDVVFWCPRTGELATLYGRAFALGEDNIVDTATYQFDNHLRLYGDPLSWLKDDGRGAVVLDWSRAFDRLRDAPRVAVSERLLLTYREAMRPSRMPELSVLASTVRLAA